MSVSFVPRLLRTPYPLDLSHCPKWPIRGMSLIAAGCEISKGSSFLHPLQVAIRAPEDMWTDMNGTDPSAGGVGGEVEGGRGGEGRQKATEIRAVATSGMSSGELASMGTPSTAISWSHSGMHALAGLFHTELGLAWVTHGTWWR